jgi:hypothetical protein
MPGTGPVAGAAPPRNESKRDSEPEADRLREEVAALRERLRSLEERLGRSKGQAK